MRRTAPVAALAAAAMLAIGQSPAVAQDYPSRTITMIVGYAAGGGTDVLARTIAPFIERELGGTIAVINRPGAGGEIGFTEIAQAEPDGYTIGLLNVPSVINPLIEREPAYALEDFAPLANIVTEAATIVVPVTSRFETLADWAQFVEENPNTIPVANSGLGGAMHTALLRFLNMKELSVINVPFPGAAPSRAALLGGHVATSVMGVSEAGPLHQEGQLRILGVMSAERDPSLPDVPTFRELGYDIVAGSYRGLAAPAGLPEDVFDRLASAVEAAVNDAEFRRIADERLLVIDYIGPEDMIALLSETEAEMRAIWEATPWIR